MGAKRQAPLPPFLGAGDKASSVDNTAALRFLNLEFARFGGRLIQASNWKPLRSERSNDAPQSSISIFCFFPEDTCILPLRFTRTALYANLVAYQGLGRRCRAGPGISPDLGEVD
jgi:hypothetical protein